MKIYLVWNHDPGYMTSSLEKIFVDGLKAGEYCRENQKKIKEERNTMYSYPYYTVQVREVEE